MSAAALEGKVALVTGASRGIGRGIARRLAADGALVAVHYATNAGAAAETVAAIEAAGGRAFAVGQPLGVAGDVAGLFAQLDAELTARTGSTHLDVVVNNAGVALQGDLAQTTEAVFDEQFAVNARAPLFIAQAAAERMGPGGRIVSISSGVTRQAWPNLLAYSMSKAAIDVMARTLAKELGPRGITVNVVAAGLVDTDMNAGWLRVDDASRAQAASVSAFGQVGEPAHVADVVAFVASDDARWVTGQVIDATGGSVL
jgi:NAD(P)-dependent dehydrogenase (short-subunit alcohol dehydrogenase family)